MEEYASREWMLFSTASAQPSIATRYTADAGAACETPDRFPLSNWPTRDFPVPGLGKYLLLAVHHRTGQSTMPTSMNCPPTVL